MSQFYARYVPPSKTVNSSNTEERQVKKRKLNDATESPPQPVPSARIGSAESTSKPRSPESPKKQNGHATVNGNDAGPNKSGHSILDKYRITEFAKAQDRTQDVKVRVRTQNTDKSKRSKSKVLHERPERQVVEIEGDGAAEQNDNSIGSKKHASIASKLSKSKQTTTPIVAEEHTESHSEPKPQLHGLEPIPQPAPIERSNITPAYAVLPAWQSSATTVDPSSRQSFDQMSLSKGLLAILHKNSIKNAFPVQSTVIPLLLNERASSGDLCISAATGSGKTLAYTIPIVEALRRQKKSGLRAVIVVPTRELVKQVSDTCNLCASGTDIDIVTTLGSKALSEERDLLIATEEIYDPKTYEAEQNAPVDWSNFSMAEMLESMTNSSSKLPPGFITRTRIKPNILVTTPGRLVDHLRTTQGFNLDDVEWMVIDEADRLLNESYQEWIEIVIPALSSRAATKERDEIFSSLHMDLLPRVVRKILLSATMTRDITKLNALGLVDPKLIVLQSPGADAKTDNVQDIEASNVEPQPDANGSYSLPTLLSETAITFKDGADKPLVLLNLLEQIMPSLILDGNIKDTATNEEDDTSDSDSTSDSDTTMTSSSTSSSDDSTSSDDSSTSSSTADSSSQKLSFKSKPEPQTHSSTPSKSPHPRALIFTRSTSSAHRLHRLLALLCPNLSTHITTLTKSHLSSSASRLALRSFTSPNSPITLLIATDRASRGIDIPGLENVINYDVPGSALSYVHRVGRTARAEKEGRAWTLVEHREGRWFWGVIGGRNVGKDTESGETRKTGCEIRRGAGRKVEKVEVRIEDEALRGRYERALEELGREVRDG